MDIPAHLRERPPRQTAELLDRLARSRMLAARQRSQHADEVV
ncbi:hypothetical protein ACIQB5_48670 [Streptomyces sp. NPDC088560]